MPTARAEPMSDLRGGLGDRRIVARGLTRRFGGKVAVQPFDLDVGPGGITGLVGPNGSGKSTLLRMLLGLVRPDGGSARVDGVALTGDGTSVRARAAYAPGEIHLYGEMRGGEHLAWFLRGRADRARTSERARWIAADLGLPLEKRVRAYSHGMKRQLLLAAALAPELGVRILDEATEGLDPEKRSQVLELLAADAAAGTTILLSSHHLGEVDKACNRLVFLQAGAKLADETAAEVARRARRLVHLSWPDGTALEPLDAELRRLGATDVRIRGRRVAAAADDPRAFLAAVCSSTALPSPSAIEHGKPSLADLYRELYGVEGV